MTPEVWLLVAVFVGGHTPGPAITQFDSHDLCERAKQTIAEIYWPDALNKGKSSWTVNQNHVWSYNQTHCIPVR